MLHHVSGDPLLTTQPILAFGINAAARFETTPLYTELYNRYPAAFASFRKRRKAFKPGMIFLWQESTPALAMLIIRETAVSAARLRYVDSCMMTLARDYRLMGIPALALAPLGAAHERATIALVIERWLGKSALPVVVYGEYTPGVQADETVADGD